MTASPPKGPSLNATILGTEFQNVNFGETNVQSIAHILKVKACYPLGLMLWALWGTGSVRAGSSVGHGGSEKRGRQSR